MGLLDLFRKKTPLFSEEELESFGVCPNCWGKQDYDGKYIEYTKELAATRSNNLNKDPKAFIQKFVEDRVTGIKLTQKGDVRQCPTCYL